MPKLAAFPKAYMDALCIDGSMKLEEWIELATSLEVDGLEFYSGLIDLRDPANWPKYRMQAEQRGMSIPMVCCSPDFTHPDSDFRSAQIEKELGWIRMTAELGGNYCRVLSGQRRPELSRTDGIRFAAESIEACLPEAESLGITLILENHYKDNYWDYPEFAQYMDVFCELIARLHSPYFGVNYDPSNTLLAGEDPLELLERVKERVVTMHASDRYLTEGTLADLRQEESGVEGYAARMCHGEIGKGLNDFDAIFSTLKEVGFDSWISIEDGVEGFDQLQRSVSFLKKKIAQHWPN
ncbi:Xylose isomerase domain-containing protein TIM barrel [Planctomycetales bacterium 10988]|nr:Xylose isomerase domain-containing protein TIM barrel [Planctomycetales bacterium 10988]